MAIEMYCMKSKSAINDLNKSFTATTVTQGNLVGEFDGFDGYIVVAIGQNGIPVNESVNGVRNYWRFSYGGLVRTFFEVESPTVISNDLCKIHIHLDVLTTYKTIVKELTGVAVRNENQFNSMLVDTKIKTYANDKLVIKEFPNAFSGESYVMAVSGGN